MSAACGEMARQWGDDDGFFLIIMPAFFPPFYNSFFFVVVYKIFYRRKKLLQLAWRKARCVGQAAVCTALKHRTCQRGASPPWAPAAPARSLPPWTQKAPLPTAPTRPSHTSQGIWLTLHTPQEETRQNSWERISWSIFFFNNMLQTGSQGHSDLAHKGESCLIWYVVSCVYVSPVISGFRNVVDQQAGRGCGGTLTQTLKSASCT